MTDWKKDSRNALSQAVEITQPHWKLYKMVKNADTATDKKTNTHPIYTVQWGSSPRCFSLCIVVIRSPCTLFELFVFESSTSVFFFADFVKNKVMNRTAGTIVTLLMMLVYNSWTVNVNGPRESDSTFSLFVSVLYHIAFAIIVRNNIAKQQDNRCALVKPLGDFRTPTEIHRWSSTSFLAAFRFNKLPAFSAPQKAGEGLRNALFSPVRASNHLLHSNRYLSHVKNSAQVYDIAFRNSPDILINN